MKINNKEEICVSASVSCMNLGNLEQAMQEVEQSKVAFYHFDVVDGRFNECFILGEPTLESMKHRAGLPIEVHLAVHNPEKYIKRFIEAGASYVAVHYEAMENPKEIFQLIRSFGAEPILAYKSVTPPGDDFTELAREVEWVLKLTVNPGFSGQKMQEQAVEHIRQMSRMIKEAGLTTKIQADGNINASTIETVVKAGAGILTGGTSGLFLKGKTAAECCDDMLRIAYQAKNK